jgi:hypothetical protein
MLDEIIAIYAIVEDLLKAIGHTEDSRVQMSDIVFTLESAFIN